jgi:cell division protease FtsH
VSKKIKTLLVWTALVAVFLALFQLTSDGPAYSLPFESLLEDVEAGIVSQVRIHDNQITVTRFDDVKYTTLGVVDDELIRSLSESGIFVHWGEEKNHARTLLLTVVPVLLIVLLFLIFLRKASGGGAMNIMELKKSRARLLAEESKATFADVGGCEEAKEALGDVVDFLRDPGRWTRSKVRLPRGLILEGPPGCGKTLLARATAGETNARFYAVAGSEFVELFVGVGAARMRDTFEIASKEAPAIVFIDELDAIGRRRGSGIGPAHEEREQTLNQLLVSMDGFAAHGNVVVIAATNRPDVLDPALVRPGRFDRRIRIPELSLAQRADVLRIHTAGMALAADASLEEIARRTEGQTGARLESLVNEAGLLAMRRARRDGDGCVALEDFVCVLERSSADGGARFDRVDALLMESASQLAQSTGKALVRATLAEGAVVEGELVWADALFLKIRADGSDPGVLVSKAQLRTLEALDGTAWIDPEDVAPDRWAGRPLDVA